MSLNHCAMYDRAQISLAEIIFKTTRDSSRDSSKAPLADLKTQTTLGEHLSAGFLAKPSAFVLTDISIWDLRLKTNANNLQSYRGKNQKEGLIYLVESKYCFPTTYYWQATNCPMYGKQREEGSGDVCEMQMVITG